MNCVRKAVEVVAELKKLGKEVAMLTGDNPLAATSVSQALGVDKVHAGLLPEGKVEAVKQLRSQVGEVVMVGDGINDAPALAAATVGIAMGGASSAQAMETADVVLMASDLRQLPYAFRLAGFTRSIMVQNIAFSLATKADFHPAGAGRTDHHVDGGAGGYGRFAAGDLQRHASAAL